MAYDSIPYPARRAAALWRPLGALGRVVVSGLRYHALYLTIIAVFALACVIAGRVSGGSAVVRIDFSSNILFLLIALVGIGWLVGITLWVMFVRPPKGSLFLALWHAYKPQFFDLRRLVFFAMSVLPVALFMATFSSFKRMIPFMAPYTWDTRFMEWDRALHGGWHPWELLQPVLGYPLVTSLVNHVYHLWIFVLFLTLIWQCWTRRDDLLRAQYLLSFLFCWIVLGTIMATAFASGGPCYYGRLTGLEDPFAPLMTYLYAANEQYPVLALNVQEMLWESYVNRSVEIGRGISAMPSMHVATSVLMALLGWRVHRWAGIAYTALAVAIMIGAVHLGWHYAIDGYVSAIVMVLIWWGAGRLARWWLARSGSSIEEVGAPASTPG